MQVSSTGVVTTTDGGALNPVTSGPLVSLPNGTQLYVSWDVAMEKVVYDVLVMDKSYIAIGYGTTMTNTDMVSWNANGLSSYQQDMYGIGEITPTTDATNAY